MNTAAPSPNSPTTSKPNASLIEGGARAGVAYVEHGVVQAAYCSHGARNPLSRSTIPGNTSTNRSTSAARARPADRDPQRVIGVDAHRGEHRRRFERLRRARRSRVHGDAVLVEREQDRLGLDAVARRGTAGGGARVGRRRHRSARRRARRRSRRGRGRSARAAPRPRPSRSTAAHAAPNPTHAGTFSMPARRARSCAPPTSNGSRRRPRRTSSAPAPFGPPSLCAVTEQRSASSARKSTGT